MKFEAVFDSISALSTLLLPQLETWARLSCSVRHRLLQYGYRGPRIPPPFAQTASCLWRQ